MYIHTVLQAHKTLTSGKHAGLNESISTVYPYKTRNCTSGKIRFGEQFNGTSKLITGSFKYRAVHWYNEVPVDILSGRLVTVKHKLREWVRQNVPIDWG